MTHPAGVESGNLAVIKLSEKKKQKSLIISQLTFDGKGEEMSRSKNGWL